MARYTPTSAPYEELQAFRAQRLEVRRLPPSAALTLQDTDISQRMGLRLPHQLDMGFRCDLSSAKQSLVLPGACAVAHIDGYLPKPYHCSDSLRRALWASG